MIWLFWSISLILLFVNKRVNCAMFVMYIYVYIWNSRSNRSNMSPKGSPSMSRRWKFVASCECVRVYLNVSHSLTSTFLTTPCMLNFPKSHLPLSRSTNSSFSFYTAVKRPSVEFHRSLSLICYLSIGFCVI